MKKDINTISLPLAGVESEHCALIVDKGLSKVPGVKTHKVELNNNRAVITTDDELETIPKAVKAVRDLGYNVDTIKKTFPVLNMSCASCATSSQSILENTPGVVKVAVNYANATAHVEYVPTITDPQKLKAALQGIGYDRVTSVEIFRPEYWERDAVELARAAHAATLGVLNPRQSFDN